MISVKVDQVLVSNVGFVVLLKGFDDPRSLPIFIGAVEAQAIAIWLNKVEIPRPLTHDLIKNLMDCLECRLLRIEINDLKEGTFFATLILDSGNGETAMDSRPSDAINLALRLDAPIHVHEHVMQEAGRVFESDQKTENEDKTSQNIGEPTIESMQKDLDKAIEDERYEDAARLRDAIKEYKDTHSSN